VGAAVLGGAATELILEVGKLRCEFVGRRPELEDGVVGRGSMVVGVRVEPALSGGVEVGPGL